MKREYLTVRFDVTELSDRERGLLALAAIAQSENDKDEFGGCPSPELEWDIVEVDPVIVVARSAELVLDDPPEFGDHVDSDRPPGTSGSWGEA